MGIQPSNFQQMCVIPGHCFTRRFHGFHILSATAAGRLSYPQWSRQAQLCRSREQQHWRSDTADPGNHSPLRITRQRYDLDQDSDADMVDARGGAGVQTKTKTATRERIDRTRRNASRSPRGCIRFRGEMAQRPIRVAKASTKLRLLAAAPATPLPAPR